MKVLITQHTKDEDVAVLAFPNRVNIIELDKLMVVLSILGIEIDCRIQFSEDDNLNMGFSEFQAVALLEEKIKAYKESMKDMPLVRLDLVEAASKMVDAVRKAY